MPDRDPLPGISERLNLGVGKSQLVRNGDLGCRSNGGNERGRRGPGNTGCGGVDEHKIGAVGQLPAGPDGGCGDGRRGAHDRGPHREGEAAAADTGEQFGHRRGRRAPAVRGDARLHRPNSKGGRAPITVEGQREQRPSILPLRRPQLLSQGKVIVIIGLFIYLYRALCCGKFNISDNKRIFLGFGIA